MKVTNNNLISLATMPANNSSITASNITKNENTSNQKKLKLTQSFLANRGIAHVAMCGSSRNDCSITEAPTGETIITAGPYGAVVPRLKKASILDTISSNFDPDAPVQFVKYYDRRYKKNTDLYNTFIKENFGEEFVIEDRSIQNIDLEKTEKHSNLIKEGLDSAIMKNLSPEDLLYLYTQNEKNLKRIVDAVNLFNPETVDNEAFYHLAKNSIHEAYFKSLKDLVEHKPDIGTEAAFELAYADDDTIEHYKTLNEGLKKPIPGHVYSDILIDTSYLIFEFMGPDKLKEVDPDTLLKFTNNLILINNSKNGRYATKETLSALNNKQTGSILKDTISKNLSFDSFCDLLYKGSNDIDTLRENAEILSQKLSNSNDAQIENLSEDKIKQALLKGIKERN